MSQNINKRDKKGYYTIFAPGTLQADFEYGVTVALHYMSECVTMKVGISGPSYNETKTIEIQPTESKIVVFKMPPLLEDGTYELQTEGISGLIFTQTSELNYKNVKPKIYIQTDKAMYKPGDLVQYRILALDEYTKPAKLQKPLHFTVLDGAYNQIKYIENIPFVKGVHSGKMQLSEQPVLGDWCICITYGEERWTRTNKSFKVAKYVLPKFSVEIEADKEVALADNTLNITIRSKYTYGKPVKGKATVSANYLSYSRETTVAQKTISMSGRGDVQFDLIKDLQMDPQYDYMSEIMVEVVMTEDLTGIQKNSSTRINVRGSRYIISVPDMCGSYEINKPIEIKAIIKRFDDKPFTSDKSKAKLRILGDSHEDDDLVFESAVDLNGVATFNFTLSKEGYYPSVKVAYEEETYHTNGFKAVDAALKEKVSPKPYFEEWIVLQILLKPDEPTIGEDFIADVVSYQPLSYFVYTILGRGKILQHEYVKLEPQAKTCSIKIKATFDMMPTAKMIAYYIEHGQVVVCEKIINLANKFENKLQITAPAEAKTGDEVTLNIKTDPNSFVGILGVDQSVLLLKSGNDFKGKKILKDLHDYESKTPRRRRSYYDPEYSFRRSRCTRDYDSPERFSGFVAQTNAHIRTRSSGCCYYARPVEIMSLDLPDMTEIPDKDSDDECNLIATSKIRKDFSENWIFHDIESTDSNGLASFTKKIPDTITSWIITGFSMNENSGFGITQKPSQVRVFQPFFLSTNLPYSIKRGEVIKVPVLVFNYLDTKLEAQVTMENDEDEYDFMESDEENSNNIQITKQVTIPSNTGEAVSFVIKPKIVGEVMLKIKAITPLAGDLMHQKLKVEPEGVAHYKNEAFFISRSNDDVSSMSHILKAEIPDDVVLDSEYLEFSAVGDIVGPTVKNLDQLVCMPCGCGEQNMINFVPNILVLQYLEAIKNDSPSIVQKAKSYIEIGYQQELKYKHKDGSYSAFGEGHSESNSWLTAYVVRSFLQARKYTTIDERIIDEGFQYLLKTQKKNGEFPQTGSLFFPSNQNTLGVSGFILLAFLEDEDYALKYKSQIEKSLQFLSDNMDSEENVYSLAICLRVFCKAKHPKAQTVMERVQLKANFENNQKWWSNFSNNNNNDIEITAYIAQSIMEVEVSSDVLAIIKWLITKRNRMGGFSSTQDTVVGLKALFTFAERYATAIEGRMTIHFEAQNKEGIETTKGTINLDNNKSLELQTHVLPKSTRQIALTTEGKGSTLLQLSYQYNLATPDAMPSFVVKYNAQKPLFPGHLLMTISVEYKHEAKQFQESNMAVMEINLPSGYTTDDDTLKSIRETKRVQQVEMKNKTAVIVVYFESLVVGKPICFDVAAEKLHQVEMLKPSAITIYDYYNTQRRATIYYQILQ
uniref:TEP1-F n=1 Tax=Stomoxys calcitrans TaxID=35570 RepID=A0A1I8NTI5_STOCA